jgi:hypothetical protein
MVARTGALEAELLSVLVLSVKPLIGGAWGWLAVRVGCARTPSLILVRDPGWLRIGDMMVDGVFRSGDAVDRWDQVLCRYRCEHPGVSAVVTASRASAVSSSSMAPDATGERAVVRRPRG